MANLPDAFYVQLKDMLEELDLQDNPIVSKVRNIGTNPVYRVTVKAKISQEETVMEEIITQIDIKIKRRIYDA